MKISVFSSARLRVEGINVAAETRRCMLILLRKNTPGMSDRSVAIYPRGEARSEKPIRRVVLRSKHGGCVGDGGREGRRERAMRCSASGMHGEQCILVSRVIRYERNDNGHGRRATGHNLLLEGQLRASSNGG